MNKIKYNRNYFNKIDTEEKAYWCGYLLGDGTIYGKSNPRLTLECNTQDKEIIDNFATEIKISPSHIKYRPEHNSYSLQLYSKEMVKDLFKIGIPTKNKSLTSKWIKFEESLYQQAFALGLFDADGSFRFEERSLRISMVAGHFTILKDFSEFLNIGGTIRKQTYDRRKWWEFTKSISKVDEMKILYNKLYKGTSVSYLKREKQKIKNAIKERYAYEQNT